MSPAGGVLVRLAAACIWRSGCSPVRPPGDQVCPQGWPSRFAGEFREDLVGSAVEHPNDLGSDELFGGHMKAVGVALNGLEQPGRWVAEFSQQPGGGGGRFVAGEDLLQRLARCTGCDSLGSDEGVGVAVADHLEVEVVGCAAPGEHGVELLPGLLPGQQAVHGVGGDALRRMDGGGIAETGRLPHIVNGQPDGELAAVVSDGQVTVRPMRVMVHRSPFFTQSVGVSRSRRSFLRVMITSPTLAQFPSARAPPLSSGSLMKRCALARWLSWATRCRVGAT